MKKDSVIEASPEERMKCFFDLEFRLSDIPFKTLIESNMAFKESLFNEYKHGICRPSWELYKRHYYSEEALNSGFSEALDKYPEYDSGKQGMAGLASRTAFEKDISNKNEDFINAYLDKSLSDDFCCPMIKDTPIFLALKQIQEAFNILKNDVVIGEYDKVSVRVDSIKQQLDGINNLEMRKSIAHIITADNDNVYIWRAGNDRELKDRWNAMKNEFNTLLSRYLAVSKLPVNYIVDKKIKTKTSETISEEVKFRDYLKCSEDKIKDHIINILTTHGRKPKKIAVIIIAAFQEGYIDLNCGETNKMIEAFYNEYKIGIKYKSTLKAMQNGINKQINEFNNPRKSQNEKAITQSEVDGYRIMINPHH